MSRKTRKDADRDESYPVIGMRVWFKDGTQGNIETEALVIEGLANMQELEELAFAVTRKDVLRVELIHDD